jgi:diguanylate cyclase (GGDEF)-like protein
MDLKRFGNALVPVAIVVGIGLVGYVDFATGVEVRVFPLYYLPLAISAWHFGRSGALVAAGLCAITLLGSNHLAGLRESQPDIMFANLLIEGVSFATVGILVASLKAATARERELSRTDPLTALPNRRAFYEEASRIIAINERLRQPVTLAYVDLDNFKKVNDTLGHLSGDYLLRRVGQVIQTCIRTGDACARLGGDEFAVCLFAMGRDDAMAMLQRLSSQLTEALGGLECPVTASIGGVAFLSAPESVEAMVSEADRRMYAAKAAGKNGVVLDVIVARRASSY